MNPRLAARIAAARKALAESPGGMLAGEIGEPAMGPLLDTLSAWHPYVDFVNTADGATFGDIDLWSSHEIQGKQYVSVDFPGRGERWLVIGQLLYEPLALERGTGQVRLFRRDGAPEGESLGELDDFLDRVLGPGYGSLVPDVEDDDWWSFLESAGLR